MIVVVVVDDHAFDLVITCIIISSKPPTINICITLHIDIDVNINIITIIIIINTPFIVNLF